MLEVLTSWVEQYKIFNNLYHTVQNLHTYQFHEIGETSTLTLWLEQAYWSIPHTTCAFVKLATKFQHWYQYSSAYP